MSDLLELIKTLQIEQKKDATSFVYYDKKGSIIKVSNKKVDIEEGSSMEILEVPTDHVKTILSGEKKLSDFKISYDSALKGMIVKEITWEDDYSNELDSVYLLPFVVRGGYKKDFYKHYHFNPVYDGAKVYIFIKNFEYYQGQLIWYNNKIYKVIKDMPPSDYFNENLVEIYLENVVLVKKPNKSLNYETIFYKLEFEGIPKIDVWYKELSHTTGQHVWINGNIYKITKDYPEQSLFDYQNNELIVSNVKLFADENLNLPFVTTVSVGDLILNNNKIYSVQKKQAEIKTPQNIDPCIFYINNEIMIEYNSLLNVWNGINTVTNEEFLIPDYIELKNPDDWMSGQLCLLGKEIYLVKIDHSYDIIVMQNLKKGYWEVELNPRTRKYLKSSGFYPQDYILFSLTAKYDPHILYRTFSFKLGDLVEDNKQIVPFIYDIEKTGVELSLYTPRYFDNYAHEIVND